MHLDYLPGTFFGPSNLVELLRHRARCQPQDLAFTYLVDGENEEVHLTYAELDRQARGIAAWLESLDLVGQRALLLYPAGLEFVAAFFGCLYAGVVAVPVYPPRRNRSLHRIQSVADDAKAKVALTTDQVLTRVEQLIDETPLLKQLTWLATCRIPEAIDEKWEMPEVHGDTLAFLQYTSGSTGTPKGVVLNHANLIHNSALIAHAFEHTRSGTGVFWLPSYHDMGLIGGILQPLYVGRPNVLMSPMTFLQKPLRWLSAISRFRGTTSGGPNFAYDLCVRKITPQQRKTLDLSSWTVAFNGAEPVRKETLDAFADAFEPCGFRREAFYPCYGMAEATLIVSGGDVRNKPVIATFEATALSAGRVVACEANSADGRPLVGCGKTLPDQKIAIANPQTMTTAADDEVGEIWVQGPSVAQGYWQQPEISEATFRARLKDTGEGPFLRTGDLGFIRNAELFITGRVKDLIIVHGVNHYPQDIELTVQRAHRRLRRDCGAAFSVEIDGREQLFVVQEVDRRKQGNLEHIFSAIRSNVAAEHDLQFDGIVLIKAGSIPKTSSGKIQRHACRSGYLDGSLSVVEQWRAAQMPKAPRPEPSALPPKPAPAPATPPVSAARAAAAAPIAKAPAAAIPAAAIPAAAVSKNGRGAARKKTTDVVLEEIQRVAKQRADGLTLDSPIVETGLDSLERTEIVSALEERFGGRFPEEVLPELETARQVVAAVEKYLGSELHARSKVSPAGEISPECYQIRRFPEYVKLRQNLDLLESSGLGNPYFEVHQSVTNDRTIIGGQELINFSSYNYVGMSGDRAVCRAAQDAAAQYGTSVSASRLVSGEKELHGQLERELAEFVGVEAGVAFVGGHATNETTIGHMLKPGDLILHDSLSHNSILQGCILSGARRRSFAHNDWQMADDLLKEFRHEYRRVLVVIEGVYSMDGDIPDLPEFIEIKNRHKALLMIDEAHSIGTIGRTGRGISEYHGANPRDVDIWMCTLSKTFGSCGGFVGGCKELVEYLKYTAPGFVYSVGLSPPNAAAALASARLLKAQPHRVATLQQRAGLFLRLAIEHGLNTGMSKDSPVVPIILANSMHCLQLSKALFARGINVQPILYPAVEESAARLRFFLTSLHTEQQIRYTIDAMSEELEQIDPAHLRRTPKSKAAAH